VKKYQKVMAVIPYEGDGRLAEIGMKLITSKHRFISPSDISCARMFCER
jgi:hypothetical protein